MGAASQSGALGVRKWVAIGAQNSGSTHPGGDSGRGANRAAGRQNGARENTAAEGGGHSVCGLRADGGGGKPGAASGSADAAGGRNSGFCDARRGLPAGGHGLGGAASVPAQREDGAALGNGGSS